MSLNNLISGSTPVFGGGKITAYSKNINPGVLLTAPKDLDIGYLKFNKMLPRLNTHYSGVTNNYLYVYLNPYKPAKTIDDYHYIIPSGIIGSKDLYFGYEPFYIGKEVSSTGHRMNQHIADFLTLDEDLVGDTKVKNLQKMQKMQSIGNLFGSAASDPVFILPQNWSEYKKEWVCILFSFPDRLALEIAEKILIQTIGSIGGVRKGPLTNISLTK